MSSVFTFSLQLLWIFALTFHVWAHAAGPTGLLNDTGQVRCFDGTALVMCTSANSGDASTYPRQDGRFGRDAAATAGQLTKVGGGDAGFDFTKVCMNGTLNCNGAANTGTAPAAADWACTKDNFTNLIWSLHSGNGDWTTFAQTTLPSQHNGAARCGCSSGWRLPSWHELQSIANFGLQTPPSVDINYFPVTYDDYYWSTDSYAPNPTNAWYVSFHAGNAGVTNKTYFIYVRLVCG